MERDQQWMQFLYFYLSYAQFLNFLHNYYSQQGSLYYSPANNFQTSLVNNQILLAQERTQSQQNSEFDLAQSRNHEISPLNAQMNLNEVRRRRRRNVNDINRYQKKDRNLNSIVLRNFVNFIHGHPQILSIIDSIIQKKQLALNGEIYLQKFKQALPSKQSYVGVGKLKGFIDQSKQNQAVKILTLILLRNFVQTDFFTVLIHCKKVSKEAREKQLKHGKIFWNFFLRQCL